MLIKRWGLCPLVLSLLVLVAGCSDNKGKADAKAVPQVVVMEIKPQRVLVSTELAGRVSAFQKAEVRPQVNGIVQQRLFTEGAVVNAGDALYRIDPALYQAAAESAQAALAKAEANVLPAQLRAERGKLLFAAKAISKQEWEEIQATYGQAKAEVDVCRAALKTARIQLGYTTIVAPIAGRIGKSSVTQGALVTANQAEPLALIQQVDPVYVDLTQSSTELLQLRERFSRGQLAQAGNARAEVQLQLENGALYSQKGTLQFTDITVDESTGMVSLRAVFPNPEGQLLAGMYARATINEGADENALLVPQLAVLRDVKGKSSVFVLGQGNTVTRRTVVTTEAVGKNWLVSEGLKPNEVVVVEGVKALRDNMLVKVQARRSAAER
ncbi:MAG: efflux RND transporter periplasmic adaptor subunit [Desulfovibrionaceae bacterium]|nr:efflux RND transporter periplasmic adaptor subunit [Desulfovibrionaceae bacterium]